MCTISLMALAYMTVHEHGKDEATRLVALLKAWAMTWVYPDEKTLLQAAMRKARHRLQVAEARMAAVAKLTLSPCCTEDPACEALASQIVLRALPCKATRALPVWRGETASVRVQPLPHVL